ncbi:hypothetical protein SDC9_69211 [bioreactor metagenome]|uniref:Uncharacterized protein n=1 Tax=bioreactor metagenome TaxID=1076179 RepID=A0A644Y858_9ZZZZ
MPQDGTLYLLLNPSELHGADIMMESLYYIFAFIMLKGLQLPITDRVDHLLINNIK